MRGVLTVGNQHHNLARTGRGGRLTQPLRRQVDRVVKRGRVAVLDAAQDAANSIEETLEDVITQRPLATVGLALGLGFLIGVTWRR